MNVLQKTIKKINRRLFDFQPYKKKLDIQGIDAEFFYGTQQAQEWYDPLKPYAKLEYEWVLQNIRLQGQNIADCGAHHGQYSVVLGKGAKGNCNLLAIDPMPMNCVLTEINLLLNGIKGRLEQCAVTTFEGNISFSDQSNGFISEKGSLKVRGKKLSNLMHNANVVKLDIEGHEFAILPQALEEMRNVHSWIIEVHPDSDRKPDELVGWLVNKGYQIHWVNREKNIVEPYVPGTVWKIHSTIFAIRQREQGVQHQHRSRGRGRGQNQQRQGMEGQDNRQGRQNNRSGQNRQARRPNENISGSENQPANEPESNRQNRQSNRSQQNRRRPPGDQGREQRPSSQNQPSGENQQARENQNRQRGQNRRRPNRPPADRRNQNKNPEPPENGA